MKRRSFSYYFGTILILLSLAGLSFTFYPVIRAYYPPSLETGKISKDGFSISIPKIHATGTIIENVDPFNKEEYDRALKKGIAHALGTSLPNQQGTMFLFAHSSGLPWELTRYNTIFLRLNELRPNDKIVVRFEGKLYTYKVRESKEVWPSEVNFLLEGSKDQLILQTCTPIGTDLKRLLVFADPVDDN